MASFQTPNPKNPNNQLDSMSAADPNFDAAVRASIETMLSHIASEEAGLLPRLGTALTPTTLLELGIQFEAARVRGFGVGFGQGLGLGLGVGWAGLGGLWLWLGLGSGLGLGLQGVALRFSYSLIEGNRGPILHFCTYVWPVFTNKTP